jgi:CHASE2 domain-containing sensor protein
MNAAPGVPRLRMLLTAGVLAAAVAAAATFTGALDPIENAALDHSFQQREAQSPDDVAVVAIDDVTFNDLEQQWPFPRSLMARAVDELSHAGAREIVIDIQYTEESTEREDMALYDAIADAGGAVLATTETDGRGNTRVLGGDDYLEEIGAQAAAANLPDEAGGVIRRVDADMEGLPTLARVVAERLGKPLSEEAFGPRGALIDYRGGPGTIPTVSFSTLIAGKVDPALLRDRVVVIGASAPTLHDQHATPQGHALMSGPEVQANAIWTALHGLPLTKAPPWLDLLMIGLGAAAIPLLALRVRGSVAAIAAPAFGLLYVAVAQQVFEQGGIVLTQAGPIAALALAMVATVAISSLLESVERQRIAEVNDLLEEQVRERTSELRATELEIIKRLGQAVESRDEETGEHIERIAGLCHRLALAAGLGAGEAELLRRASAMHDVGKIAIPDHILRKADRLTPEERAVMQRHTDVGGDLLAGSRSPVVQLGEVIARTHHEHWDGTGYPLGLAGEEIPLAGRITAICDVFDALVSARPYKTAWAVEDALDEIRALSGSQFDPRLVELFLEVAGADVAVAEKVRATHL